jgi:hypothetical protein
MRDPFLFKLCFCALVIVLGASFSSAQAKTADAEYDKYIALLRKDFRADKKEIIKLNVPMSEAEAAKFWPVYEQYSTELAAVYDKRLTIINDFTAKYEAGLTDASAASLVKQSIDNDQSLSRLRQKYVPLFGKVLTGKKLAQFFQLERRLGLLIDLQIASEIPLVLS